MKRITALLLALCLLLTLAPGAFAAEEVSGVCGDDARWSYENGTITISGTGAMWDFRNDADYFDYHGPRSWEHLRGEIRKVVIEEGITEVGANAFAGSEELTEVELPSSLRTLDAFAFNYCPKLTGVVLPEGLEALGQQAFAGSAITTIDIPASVSFLDNAFVECTSLTKATIRSDPNLGAFISGSSPFSSCTSLTAIEVEEGHCALVDFDGVLYVKNGDYYQLQQYPCARPGSVYEIVEGTLTIEQFAMYAAVYPETVIVPAGVEYIGYGAFSAYTPDHVSGPQGVKDIYFRGSAPQLHEGFAGTNLYGRSCTAYYPAGDASWDSVITGYFGDGMTWMPYTPENPFTDVPVNSFYEAPVLWAVENGITNGTSATAFSPDADCNRAAVVTFLWRAAGSPEPASTSHPFVDVAAGSFYEKAVLWAVENGITNGTDATHFGPTATCNRAQVVTFLYRAQNNPAFTGTVCPFTDVAAGQWYEAPILWAVENGITNGMGDGTFGVNKTCNRAQVVTFLYRAYVN